MLQPSGFWEQECCFLTAAPSLSTYRLATLHQNDIFFFLEMLDGEGYPIPKTSWGVIRIEK
jgi:hypothetical protein